MNIMFSGYYKFVSPSLYGDKKESLEQLSKMKVSPQTLADYTYLQLSNALNVVKRESPSATISIRRKAVDPFPDRRSSQEVYKLFPQGVPGFDVLIEDPTDPNEPVKNLRNRADRIFDIFMSSVGLRHRQFHPDLPATESREGFETFQGEVLPEN